MLSFYMYNFIRNININHICNIYKIQFINSELVDTKNILHIGLGMAQLIEMTSL